MDIAYAIFIMITVFVALPLSLAFCLYKAYKKAQDFKNHDPIGFKKSLIAESDPDDGNEIISLSDSDNLGWMGLGHRADVYNN